MTKIWCVMFILCTNISPLFSQWQDSIETTRNSRYLSDLMAREGSIYPGVGKGKVLLQLEHLHFNYRNQNLVKVGKQLYLYLYGTGIIYNALPSKSTDSAIRFKRLDRTYNADYNRGSFFYTYNKKIYNIGGYGFWRSNGINRVFNEDDGEWDVAPVSEEIIPDVNVNWHDMKEDKIYVPFQNIKNAATADEELIKGVIDDRSYVLDLKSSQWKQIGRCTPRSINILTNGGLHMHSSIGLWVVAYDNCYLFDFQKNNVLKLRDKTLAHSISRIFAKQQHSYFYNGKIYFESMQDLKYDSLAVDVSKFELEPYPIVERSTPILYVLFGAGILLLCGAVVILWIRRKRLGVGVAASLQVSHENIRSSFTETEVQLLETMIANMQENKTTSMQDINYILGVKDKNVGLQKKVRSDVINSINEKYKRISQQDTPLIRSIRSENDKRYFAYVLNEVQYEVLKGLNYKS